ncbi:MAG: restriction endonuclease subunit R, partial [candidate division NC10 bacterium]|nr:restriction endonuclease subunit R [candidate division NC10 bacterium]
LRPQSLADRALLQQAVTQLLCRYVDRFYQARREQWDEQTMVYRPLDKNDPNLALRPQGVIEGRAGYVVKVKRSEQQLVKAVEALLQEQSRLYAQENDTLPRINFDRHLYQPLLVDIPDKDKVQMVPAGLKESEERFVSDLRDYWNKEKDRALAVKELFLLRNLSRGYGIGFFEERRFYPDFILWLVDQQTRGQRIIFVEPHGMLHAKAYIHDEKARLWERLPALAAEIGKRSGHQDISLDAFIISATPFEELRKRYDDGNWDRAKFAEHHILFREPDHEYDYLTILLNLQPIKVSD